MKTLMMALVLVAAPIGEWETEIKRGDVWDGWSDRLVLRFRPEAWDGITTYPITVIPPAPGIDA
jgi:hypothetical protein